MDVEQKTRRRIEFTSVKVSIALFAAFGAGLSVGVIIPPTIDSSISTLERDPMSARFLGLRETIQWVLDEGRDPSRSSVGSLSPSGIKIYNEAARSFNAAFGDNEQLAILPEDTTANVVTHPRAIEVMGEVDFALQVLSNAQATEE